MAKSLNAEDITIVRPTAEPDGWFPDSDNRDDANPWDDNDPWNH